MKDIKMVKRDPKFLYGVKGGEQKQIAMSLQDGINSH